MLPIQLRSKFKTNLTLKLSNREKVLGLIFLSSLMIFFYYNVIYSKQIQQLKTLAEEKKQKEQTVQEYKSLGFDNINKLIKHKEETEKNSQELFKEVPGYIGEPEILVDINQLVGKLNLYCNEISYGEYKQETGYGLLPVTFTVEGDQINIYRFIEHLEYGKRMIRVSSAKFDPAGAGGFWVTCIVRADYYVLGEEPQKDPDNYDFLKTQYGAKPSYDVIRPPIDTGESDNSEDQTDDGSTNDDSNNDNTNDGSQTNPDGSLNNDSNDDILPAPPGDWFGPGNLPDFEVVPDAIENPEYYQQ